MEKIHNDDFEEVLLQMQWALDMWNGMIQATRGALVPDKTFWYAIDFSCHNRELEYSPQEDLPANLKMLDMTG